MASIIKKLINGILSDVIQLEHSAQDIDDSITKTSQLTGRNLLDNWYFADPINQRGQTSYTGAVYGIDRWRSPSGNTIAVESSGLRITGSDDTSFSNMIQQNFPEELLNALDGKTVTASILVSENTGGGAVAARLGSVPGSAVTTGLSTYTVTFNKSSHTYFCIQYDPSTTANFVVQAVKLELGTQQTLARKAVDGTWVLIDPPPNKAEELAKCQRYFVKFEGSIFNGLVNNLTTMFFLSVDLPVTMRVRPVVGAYSLNYLCSGGVYSTEITSLTPYGGANDGTSKFYLQCTTSSELPLKTTLAAYMNYLYLSADL